MTYISRKTRLLVPRWFDECDPACLYHLNRKRSDGRLKRHGSCDDLRAWVDDQYLNYQYLLELMTDGEIQGRPFLGLMGRIIPVENIVDVLCGDALHGGEEYEKAVGSRLGKMGRKPRDVDGSDETFHLAGKEDILKITNAAVSKLENIRNLLHSTSDSQTNRPCDEDNDFNLQWSCDNPGPDEVVMENNVNREEYLAEYNSIVRKISSLRHRLGAINQRREELCAKVESSRQATCRSSSDMTIKELYSREEHMYAKRIQKWIEKLVKEKGQVLNEMCEAMKYLNELKKKIDSSAELLSYKKVLSPEKEYLKKPRKCPRNNENNEDGFKKEKDGSAMSSDQRKKREVGSSDSEGDLRGERSREDSTTKYPQQLVNNSDTIYPNNTKKDVDLKVMYTPDARTPKSQKTQLQDSDQAGYKKSTSESTVNDLEQILRSYEKRLSDLGYIEVQIEELKKRASMANYFKKWWLRCSSKGRAQKIAERLRMKEEMKQLYMENNELKKLIVKLTEKSEREQNEIQYLKCKHKQLSEMEEEMTELKKDLKGYQISFDTQRECIDSLENTVTRQRDRIHNLMTHIRRLSGVTDNVKDIGRISKKCPRSRSYGPECKKNLKKTMVLSSEESLQSSAGCRCCTCTHHSEAPNRPRSECTRRMTLVPQTWRRQSCNN